MSRTQLISLWKGLPSWPPAVPVASKAMCLKLSVVKGWLFLTLLQVNTFVKHNQNKPQKKERKKNYKIQAW